MRGVVLAVSVLAALAAAAGGGGGKSAAPSAVAATRPACPAAWLPGWQRLADRIDAPVYCPSWLPDPLTGQIGGDWNNLNSVDPDGSYLMGFIWWERQSGELHVNLRGYPGRTRIPTCIDVNTVAGVTRRTKVPCFSDARGRKRVPGIDATVYTLNRDADDGHVLYAWRHDGTLYTLSEHVAPPLDYRKVVRNLDRMLRGLVLVRPSAS